MTSKRRVVINGAGIAGLSAALAFAKLGWFVEVHERSETLESVGAGIQITPNMFSALAQIDSSLIKQIRSVSTHPEKISIHKAGKTKNITSIPLGRQTEISFGFPYTVIHRADLQNILYAKCKSDPDIEMHFSSSVVDFALHKNGNTVLIKQKAEFQETTCSLLIIADGIHSKLRVDKLNLPKATDSGKIAWRCLIPENHIEDKSLLRKISLRLAKNRHVVSYPVRSGDYLNMVAIMDKSQTGDVTHLTGKQMAVLFKKWSKEFKALLETSSDWTGWPLLEMEHYDKPRQKSVAIIGDAAHAMLPFAAQGAGMAIEDAVILAKHIDQTEDLEKALSDFYNARFKRIKRVSKLAQSNGKFYHDSGLMALCRNIYLKLAPGKTLLNRQNWVYNWRP